MFLPTYLVHLSGVGLKRALGCEGSPVTSLHGMFHFQCHERTWASQYEHRIPWEKVICWGRRAWKWGWSNICFLHPAALGCREGEWRAGPSGVCGVVPCCSAAGHPLALGSECSPGDTLSPSPQLQGYNQGGSEGAGVLCPRPCSPAEAEMGPTPPAQLHCGGDGHGVGPAEWELPARLCGAVAEL